MGKMLLQKFTGNTSVNENSAVVTGTDEHKALPELMKDMKAVLDEAASELLQPRQEAIDQLLQKAGTLH